MFRKDEEWIKSAILTAIDVRQNKTPPCTGGVYLPANLPTWR
ncbi:MAG: hypothetical protein RL210_2378 [Pseudomonadota bacterium]|jgi:hypothetical protein